MLYRSASVLSRIRPCQQNLPLLLDDPAATPGSVCSLLHRCKVASRTSMHQNCHQHSQAIKPAGLYVSA